LTRGIGSLNSYGLRGEKIKPVSVVSKKDTNVVNPFFNMSGQRLGPRGRGREKPKRISATY